MESDCRLEEGGELRRENTSLNIRDGFEGEPVVLDVQEAEEGNSNVRDTMSDMPLRCEENACEFECSTQEELGRHMEAVHSGRRFRCNLCAFSCLTHGGLYLHKNAVHLGIRYKCDKCSYEATQDVNLKRHIESKHGNILHCCKLCNVQTRVSYYAENHLKKKHGILDKLQYADLLERKFIWPKNESDRDSEEERQLEEEMKEEEEENDDDNDGSYLDPSELLEQSDLIEDDPEDSSDILYPSVEINMEEEDSVPDIEFLDSSKVGRDSVEEGRDMKHKLPQFQCKQCEYVAHSSGTLTRHVSVVHKGVRWACKLCGYVTTVKCSMVRHIQSIHQGWRYKCPFCTHESTQKGGLKYHIEKKHPGEAIVPSWNNLAPVKTRTSSQIPGIEDMDVNQMFDELSDATSQEIYTDSVQNEDYNPEDKFAQAYGRNGETSTAVVLEPRVEIRQVEEEHDNIEDTTGPEAVGQYVGDDYDFTELYSRFTGEEDVQCDLCTYTTARMGNMRRHVLANHQGVRFPCDQCDYRAPDKGSLLRHARGVHQGIRYYCDFCPYSATQKGNLKKHQEMKHCNNFYTCTYCEYKVNWKGSFIKHLQNQHGDLMSSQGLGITGETNPLLSFNVKTFEGTSHEIEEEEEEEEEQELDKTEDMDSSFVHQEEEKDDDCNPIKSQNMSPTDMELEGSKIVLKTDNSKKHLQFKIEETVVVGEEVEDNGLSTSFQCTLCKYTANSSASLARHNGAVHKGIRWQCKDCDFITRDKSSLKRHRRNRHDGIRFKCNYCDYDAGQKGNIKSHMDRKHPEIPYDHTEFQEVRVEKSKYTREAKQEKEQEGLVGLGPMAGFLGLGGLSQFSAQMQAHLITTLLQARMKDENNSFHSTDDDSNMQSSDREEEQLEDIRERKEEDAVREQEEVEDIREQEEVQDLREQEEVQDPEEEQDEPQAHSTPTKPHTSLLLSALQALPCSSSPTLTPRKSLLDLLNISHESGQSSEDRSPKPLVSRTKRAEVMVDGGEGYTCQECTFSARSQGTLFRHIQSVHRGVRFKCDYCDFITIDKGSLKRHVNGQHKGLKHRCDFCDYENAQIGNVKKHIQTKHQNLVYPCPYCSLEAKHKWYLEQHVRKTHTDKLFVFDVNNVTPQATQTSANQEIPNSPPGLPPSLLNPLLTPAGLLPPSLLLLHPMAKFLVPDALKMAQDANVEDQEDNEAS